MEIIKTTYSEIAPFRKQARIDGADLTDYKIPITWFKVVENDNILGCIGLLGLGKTARVRGWFVEKSSRSKGVGSFLLSNLEEYAKNQGFTKIEMNTRHIEMVKKRGYTSTGKVYKMQQFFFGHGEKMEKTL